MKSHWTTTKETNQRGWSGLGQVNRRVDLWLLECSWVPGSWKHYLGGVVFSFQNETFSSVRELQNTNSKRFSKFRELLLKTQHQLPHPKLWRAMNFIREQRSAQPGQEVALLEENRIWPSSHSLQSYGQFPPGHKRRFSMRSILCPITSLPPQPHLLPLEAYNFIGKVQLEPKSSNKTGPRIQVGDDLTHMTSIGSNDVSSGAFY